MGCLSENAVLEFLQGGLTAEAAVAVEDHLDGCADCRQLIAETARSLGDGERLGRGAAIGRYVVVGVVGAGGMGVVYAAWDPELDRKVALKLLRPDVQGASGAQLLREAQAMARLSHGNVVAVHDAGTWEGRVFVAMDYAEGETLAAWQQGRPWREILDAYVRAGRGLAAAHAAGLVHRDFKPDNVLVDKAGGVRVTDFGLARPLGATAAVDRPAVLAAETTTAIAGTPAYMAPEQCLGRPVDARTDQFSFCVALYEALYGERPFVDEGPGLPASPARLEGRVREAPRGARVPLWVRRVLVRGLAARPEDRFPSMAALLDALARDPTVVWRRRTAAAVAIALVAAGAVVWQHHRVAPCRGAERRLAGVWDDARRQAVHAAFRATAAPWAEDAFAGATRALDDYAAGWLRMHADACAATRVRGEQSDELMDLRMQCLDERLHQLDELAGLYTRADADVVRRAVQAAGALEPLDGCADRKALLSRERPVARRELEPIVTTLARAKALEDAGKYRDERPLAEQALAQARAAHDRPLEADAWYRLARCQDRLGEVRAAETSLHESVRAAQAGRSDRVAAAALLDLMWVTGYEQGRHADGDELARDAAALVERLGNPDAMMMPLEIQRGTLAGEEWRLDEAVRHYTRALALAEKVRGPDSLDVATILTNLGVTQHQRGAFAEDEAAQRRALAIRERLLGRSHPDVAAALTDLGNALASEGRYDEAIAAHDRALAIWKAAVGERHPSYATALANRAAVYGSQARYDEALADLQRALAVRTQVLGANHLDVATTQNDIGQVLHELGRDEEAAAWLGRALAVLEKLGATGHPDYADTLANLARVELSRHRPREALALANRAGAIWEKALGPDHPALGSGLLEAGEAELALGEPEKARPLLERAAMLRDGRDEPVSLAETRFALARALGSGERAVRLAEAARDTFARDGKRSRLRLAEVTAWLQKHE